MRISVKGRYGLAAMIHLAQNHANGLPITIISIAEKFGISKIYLEQVFSLLKRSNLVISTKGAQGGYQLKNQPDQITVYDILAAIELSLVEKTENTVKDNAPILDQVLQKCVFDEIDNFLKVKLSSINLLQLASEVALRENKDDYMYFI